MTVTNFGRACLIGFVFAACGSDTTGGAVKGQTDAHCGTTVQPTDPTSCMDLTGGSAAADFGPNLYNAEGDDDDCKYHVVWTSTAVEQNKDVTFSVTLTSKVDNTPVTGAETVVEALLSDLHLAPNTHQTHSETAAGVYVIKPVQFDKPGRWTVRYHFFESCNSDAPESPHAHAGFYVDVP